MGVTKLHPAIHISLAKCVPGCSTLRFCLGHGTATGFPLIFYLVHTLEMAKEISCWWWKFEDAWGAIIAHTLCFVFLPVDPKMLPSWRAPCMADPFTFFLFWTRIWGPWTWIRGPLARIRGHFGLFLCLSSPSPRGTTTKTMQRVNSNVNCTFIALNLWYLLIPFDSFWSRLIPIHLACKISLWESKGIS